MLRNLMVGSNFVRFGYNVFEIKWIVILSFSKTGNSYKIFNAIHVKAPIQVAKISQQKLVSHKYRFLT